MNTLAPISPQDAAERMKKIREASTGDTEADMSNSERLLCDVLRSLGYGECVAEFKQISKW